VERKLHEFDFQTVQRARHFKDPVYRSPKSIYSLQALSSELPKLCNAIVKCIGVSHSEDTYQNCLGIHLKDMGIHVEYEVEIPLVYQNHHVVTNRRADLVLTLPNADGLQVVLELKKGRDIEQEYCIDQLHQYMHLLDINHGFLISFPTSSRRWEPGHLKQEKMSRSLYFVGVQGVSDCSNVQESTFESDDFSDDEECCQIIQASFDRSPLYKANHKKTRVYGKNQKHFHRYRRNWREMYEGDFW
jgi:GxxExxY protein